MFNKIRLFVLKMSCLIHRKDMVFKLKPALVFWYISFDGDQDRIAQAMEDNWGLDNVENFNKVLKGVNLDDYVILIEKDFEKYSPQPLLIVKKPKEVTA